jgi:hypothetical protein
MDLVQFNIEFVLPFLIEDGSTPSVPVLKAYTYI